jgi:hypothetical protein
MSSKKTTTSNSTTTNTPINPEWLTQAIQGQTGIVGDLAARDPYSFIAPASGLQNQAFQIAGGLGGQVSDWLNQSADTAHGLASYAPQSVSGNAQSVSPVAAFGSLGAADPTQALASALSGEPTNPYLAAMNQANINQSLQGYDDALSSAANTLTRSVLPSIRSGGMLAGQYGGSRQGIAEGVALGDLGTQLGQNARNLAQSAMDSGAQLYGGAYENAQQRAAQTATQLAGLGLQNAQGDADRSLQAATADQQAGLQGANLNLNAAQYLGGLGQYGLGALGELGGTQQALDQAYRQAPLNLAQITTGMYGQLPYNLFHGETTNSNGKTVEKSSNPMQTLTQLASLAAIPLTGGASAALGGLGGLGSLGSAGLSSLVSAPGFGGNSMLSSLLPSGLKPSNLQFVR